MARWPSLFFRLGKVIGFWRIKSVSLPQSCSIWSCKVFWSGLLDLACGFSCMCAWSCSKKIEGSKLPKHHGKEITVPAAFQQSSRVFHILHWTSSFSQLGSASQKSQVAPSASMGFFFHVHPVIKHCWQIPQPNGAFNGFSPSHWWNHGAGPCDLSTPWDMTLWATSHAQWWSRPRPDFSKMEKLKQHLGGIGPFPKPSNIPWISH